MDLLNAFVALLNFVIIPATAYGSQLALGALGVTLIYGILRFSNFAHGDTMAFGAMVTILIHLDVPGDRHLDPARCPRRLVALPFGIAATALMMLADRPMGLPLSTAQAEGQADHPRDGLAGRDVRAERHCPGHHRPGRAAFQRWRAFHHPGRDFKEMTGLSEGLAFRRPRRASPSW